MKYLSSRLSAAMWARVLVLWLTLCIGAVVVAGVSLWLGGFIQSNIRNELASQQISFTPADKLADAEKQVPGILDNAGQPLTTGNQAQAYAGLMALHLKEAADGVTRTITIPRAERCRTCSGSGRWMFTWQASPAWAPR